MKKVSQTACFVAIIILVLVCWGCKSEARKFYRLGRHFEDQEQYGQAVVEYQKALDKEPDMIEAQFHLGLALRGAGMLEQARQALQKTLELKPRHTGALIALGEIAYARKDLKHAEKRARQVLEIDENNIRGLTLIGGVLLDKKDFAGAAHNFEKALDQQGINPDVHYALAFAYFNMHEPDRTKEAIKELRVAQAQGKDISKAIEHFSIELKKRGKSIEEYEAAGSE